MKKNIAFALLGALISFVLLTGIRFALYHEEHTHFHANFALYIDGKRFELKDNKYMEAVTACYAVGTVQPKQRVHMHNNDQDVVHVHADGVTWGHFLINIGFNIGSDYLVDDSGTYYKSGENGKSLLFILNGDDVESIGNKLMRSEDKLLISYGEQNKSELLDGSFKEMASNAHEFNGKHDPAGCAGEESISFSDRLKKSILP